MFVRGGGCQNKFCHFIFLLVWSIRATMPNFSFLECVILTIPGGVGWVVGELGNKTKLQPSSVKVELWLSLAILISTVLPNICAQCMPLL